MFENIRKSLADFDNDMFTNKQMLNTLNEYLSSRSTRKSVENSNRVHFKHSFQHPDQINDEVHQLIERYRLLERTLGNRSSNNSNNDTDLEQFLEEMKEFRWEMKGMICDLKYKLDLLDNCFNPSVLSTPDVTYNSPYSQIKDEFDENKSNDVGTITVKNNHLPLFSKIEYFLNQNENNYNLIFQVLNILEKDTSNIFSSDIIQFLQKIQIKISTELHKNQLEKISYKKSENASGDNQDGFLMDSIQSKIVSTLPVLDEKIIFNQTFFSQHLQNWIIQFTEVSIVDEVILQSAEIDLMNLFYCELLQDSRVFNRFSQIICVDSCYSESVYPKFMGFIQLGLKSILSQYRGQRICDCKEDALSKLLDYFKGHYFTIYDLQKKMFSY